MRKTILQWSRELNVKPFWLVAEAVATKKKYWTVKTRICESTARLLRENFTKRHPQLLRTANP